MDPCPETGGHLKVSPAQAQARLDAWCARKGDARRRVRDGERTTAGALMAAEPLMPLPAVPFRPDAP